MANVMPDEMAPIPDPVEPPASTGDPAADSGAQGSVSGEGEDLKQGSATTDAPPEEAPDIPEPVPGPAPSEPPGQTKKDVGPMAITATGLPTFERPGTRGAAPFMSPNAMIGRGVTGPPNPPSPMGGGAETEGGDQAREALKRALSRFALARM